MNKSPLLLALVLALSGCQTLTTLDSDSQVATQANEQLEGASPNDINNALMVNAQYQQVADDNEQAAPIFDDVWERIRYQLSIKVPQNRPVVTQRNYYAKPSSLFRSYF